MPSLCLPMWWKRNEELVTWPLQLVRVHTKGKSSLPQQRYLGPGILRYISAIFGMVWSLVGPHSLISAPSTSKAFILHQNARISHFVSVGLCSRWGSASSLTHSIYTPPQVLPLSSPTGVPLILWAGNLEQAEKTTLYFSSCLPGAPKGG